MLYFGVNKLKADGSVNLAQKNDWLEPNLQCIPIFVCWGVHGLITHSLKQHLPCQNFVRSLGRSFSKLQPFFISGENMKNINRLEITATLEYKGTLVCLENGNKAININIGLPFGKRYCRFDCLDLAVGSILMEIVSD